MNPYYQESGITIFHGDAREILPQRERDALVESHSHTMQLWQQAEFAQDAKISQLTQDIEKMTQEAMEHHADHRREAEALRAALRNLNTILTESTLACRHPADDGSDDCGNFDECAYHQMLQELDAALAGNSPASAPEEKA